MTKHSAVLFDLDGTLLDTALDLHAATNHVLESHRFDPISIEQAKAITSNGASALLQAGFGEQFSNYDQEDLRNRLLDYYHRNISVFTQPFNGIVPLLTKLDKQNIPWGIITNKPEALTQLLLSQQPSLSSCRIMLGADSLPQKKPHPMPLLHAAKFFNMAPEQCLYVGDHDRDIEAGRRANMTTVSVAWGYFAADEDPLDWQADHHIQTPEELLRLI